MVEKNRANGVCVAMSSTMRSMPSENSASASMGCRVMFVRRGVGGSSVTKRVVDAYSPWSGQESACQVPPSARRATMPPSPIWATSVSCPLDRARTSVQAKSRAESPRLSAAARMRWRASSTHVRTVSAEGRADAVSRGSCRDDALGVDAAARWRRAAWRIVRQVMMAPCRPWLALPAPSHVTATNHSALQVWLSLLTGTTAQAWAS